MSSPDPWSALLAWLTTIIVPDWGELVNLVPFFVIIGLAGPILTLIVLMWGWYLLKRRRGRVRYEDRGARPAPRRADGGPAFPVNTPYCARHEILYPARERRCPIDDEDLLVICPVDGTVRDAYEQVCGSCGTRFVLGAGGDVLARPLSGPPSGGAAAA